MRKIQFRGKSLNSGKWAYGDLFHIDNKTAICPTDDINWMDGSELESSKWCWVDPETIGQFTGLLDRNGKEIYEGDIIRIDCHPWLDWKELDSVNAEVLFEDYVFDARWRNPDAGQPIPFHPDDDPDYESEYICEMLANLPNTIEIIGNIHDTPEMLK